MIKSMMTRKAYRAEVKKDEKNTKEQNPLEWIKRKGARRIDRWGR